MRSRTRSRRALSRGGLIACLLILATFCTSVVAELAWTRWWTSPGGPYKEVYLAVEGGFVCLGFVKSRTIQKTAGGTFYIRPRDTRSMGQIFWWQPPCLYTTGSGWSNLRVAIPLWLLLVSCLILTAVRRHRARQLPAGFCQMCGYDLTGNSSGRCPECGTPSQNTK